MKIYLASDHAGFQLKEKLKVFLEGLGYEIKDFGAYEYNTDDDYPDFIREVASAVANDPEHSRGVVIGGSGQGEAMVANRFSGVRAAVFYGAIAPKEPVDVYGESSTNIFEILKLSRKHNDANVLSLGARFISEDEAKEAVKIWLETEFAGEERHIRRIKKIG